ncbi:MAG: polyprenyl synthetase family protein [Sphingobacteriaceae bacterium]
MHTIEQLQEILAKAVKEQQYPANPAELYEPISYLMALGGKRMRPVLLLMACELFEGDIKKALDAALAIEVFHNFTLMHDDIMDKAPIRRGQPTVHEKWDANVAILSGDVMLVEGYKLLSKLEPELLKPALQIFNETAVGVCEGQQLDMNFESRAVVRLEEYLEMIRLKTAVLLGGALNIGAIIAKAPQKEAELLASFGENLGIAFQLQDDILDVYGDPDKFGKQVGGDIISNKKTYLLIKAKVLAQGETASELNYWLNQTVFKAEDKVSAVTAIYERLQVRQLAEADMQHYAEKALAELASISVSSERKTALQGFAEQLLVREH